MASHFQPSTKRHTGRNPGHLGIPLNDSINSLVAHNGPLPLPQPFALLENIELLPARPSPIRSCVMRHGWCQITFLPVSPSIQIRKTQVETFLNRLATQTRVTASAQWQALNATLQSLLVCL
jgi:hypothetical protein